MSGKNRIYHSCLEGELIRIKVLALYWLSFFIQFKIILVLDMSSDFWLKLKTFLYYIMRLKMLWKPFVLTGFNTSPAREARGATSLLPGGGKHPGSPFILCWYLAADMGGRVFITLGHGSISRSPRGLYWHYSGWGRSCSHWAVVWCDPNTGGEGE